MGAATLFGGGSLTRDLAVESTAVEAMSSRSIAGVAFDVVGVRSGTLVLFVVALLCGALMSPNVKPNEKSSKPISKSSSRKLDELTVLDLTASDAKLRLDLLRQRAGNAVVVDSNKRI